MFLSIPSAALAAAGVLASLLLCYLPAKGHDPVILTSAQPIGSFAVNSQTALGKSILRVDVSKIDNPFNTPFQVVVYFAIRPETSKAQPRKVRVGSFSPYPSDQPGNFEMSTAAAVRAIKAAGVDLNSADIELVLELRSSRPGESLASVQVTAKNLEWRNPGS